MPGERLNFLGKYKGVNYVQQESSSNKKKSKVHLELEEWENLMIRRTLIKQPIKEEPSQEENSLGLKMQDHGKIV